MMGRGESLGTGRGRERGRGERVDDEIGTQLVLPGVLPLVAVGGAAASWETLPNIVHLSLVRAVCETRRDETVSTMGKWVK